MNQELNIKDFDNQERVIKHLRRADWLLIGLPMVLSAVLFVIVPIVWSVAERLSGNPTEIGGFNFDGLVIIAGIILFLIFCVGYGFLAFILSLVTRRNRTFRILLLGIPLTIAIIFAIYYFLS